MQPTRWVKACQVADLPPGQLRRVEVDALNTVTLVNVDGTFYALAGSCSHQNFPLWAGRVVKNRVVCPGHSWQFDACTGRPLLPRDGDPVRTYPVKVEADDVLIEWTPPPFVPRRRRT